MENYNGIYDESKGNVLTGFIGALLGALIGAVVWAVIGAFGYIVSIAGFLIAFLASKGYDLMKGRPGIAKFVVLIVCVLIAVFIGNVGTVAYQIYDVYNTEGYSSWIELGQFFEMMVPALMEDSEFMSSFWKDSGMGILFAALGCYGLLRNTLSKKQSQQKVAAPEEVVSDSESAAAVEAYEQETQQEN